MKTLLPFMAGIFLATLLHAQEKPSTNEAQANNPLANMTALNFQNNYITKLTNAPDEAYMNTTWIRYAQPIASGKLLLRVSAPLSTVGAPDAVTGKVKTVNGLGDINGFLSYNFVSKPAATLGIGPMITIPSSSQTPLGTGKWQGGGLHL